MGCFFFQAEDGIRDGHVTGVQTCALPICQNKIDIVVPAGVFDHRCPARWLPEFFLPGRTGMKNDETRSEERRVGKECRSRRSPDAEKKKTSTPTCAADHYTTRE